MKKHFKLFSLLILLVLFSCNTEDIAIETTDGVEQQAANIVKEKIYEQGFVRIKVEENLSTRMEQATRSGSSATRGMNADDVLDKVQVIEMKRTFPYAGRFEERTRKEGLHLWYDVIFSTDVPLAKIQGELKSINGVSEVELRPVIHNLGNGRIIKYVEDIASSYNTPNQNNNLPFNDTQLSNQWHYQNDGTRGSKYVEGADINLFDAWEMETGSPQVIVAIVDGGIQYDHEDLAANMWSNIAERDGADGYDDDGNGYVDDIYGYNFVANSGKISAESHGTHVAGTVAAVNNNGKGVSGVAGGDGTSNSGVRLMSCQIFVEKDDPYADFNGRGGAAAIKYGADNGAVISQNSWGYPDINYTPASDKEAIDYFIKYAGIDENDVQTGPMRGGLVIFAAGNENKVDGPPASYSPVLSVSAIAGDYKKAYYSNYGSWVTVAAPGGDYYSFGESGLILSTVPNNKYAFMQGTSMACPHVSGVAALIVSNKQSSELTPSTVRNAIVNSGRDINSYNTNYKNRLGVLVDATMALGMASTIAPDKVENLTGSVQSNSLELSWTVPKDDDNVKPKGFNVYLSKESLDGLDPANPSSKVITKSFNLSGQSVGDKFSVLINSLEFETKYYIAVSAFDLGSNFSELSNIINLTTGKNNPPVITTTDKTSFTLKAHEGYKVSFKGSDKDNHKLTWSLSEEPKGISFNVLNEENAELIIDAVAMSAGNYKLTVALTDEFMAKDELNVEFTILPNTPPKNIKSFENQVIIGAKKEQEYKLSDYITDEDGENLQYQITSSDQNVVSFVVNNGIAKLTTNKYGMADIKIIAQDAKGETAIQEFKVLVKATDSPLDIYPNPVKDNLWVRTNKDAQCKVTIHNSAGAEVYNDNISSSPFNPSAINVSSYAAGVYSVKVVIDGVEHKKQIIKQ